MKDFHEIGAVDSIVDIVEHGLAFELLKIEHFYSSPCPWGTEMSLPNMAFYRSRSTLQLLSMAQAPLVSSPSPGVPAGELVALQNSS
jgi:hypothetical protein